MGYTHYQKQSKAIVLTSEQKKLIQEVREDYKDILGVNVLSPSLLHINGIEDEAHEDFYVQLAKTSDFEFCKTVRAAYDLPVCKLLLVLSLSPGFTFSSDGDYANGEENWKEAKEWFAKKGHTYEMEGEKDVDAETPTKQEDNVGIEGLWENHEEGHDKFWKLEKKGKGYEATWGKCGAEKPGGPKKYSVDEAEKLIKAKEKKGYVRISEEER